MQCTACWRHKRREAVAEAFAEQVSTLIGYGSPNKADTHDVHGAPLGKDETAATRENLKWNYGEFEVGLSSALAPGQSRSCLRHAQCQ